MIDTIKFQIPLTKRQYLRIQADVLEKGREQWAIYRPGLAEPLTILRYKGILESDQPSYRREILWDVPDRFREGDTWLTVELSLPKYHQGHNVYLLYDWEKALRHLGRLLQRELVGRSKFPGIEEWRLRRLDLCYAWKLPNEETARAFIDALKRLKYPWKKPVHYPTTASWPGRTFSAKVYAKHPEFRKHDLCRMLKGGASHEFVNWVEERSKGVVRFEITCRSQWLRENDIETVGDITGMTPALEVSPELWRFIESIKGRFPQDGPGCPTWKATFWVMEVAFLNYPELLSATKKFESDGELMIGFPEMSSPALDEDGKPLIVIPAGSIRTYLIKKPLLILKKQLTRLVGDGDMSIKDKIRERLEAHYQSTKVGRLMGFWHLVQQHGAYEAREIVGDRTFQRNVKDLRDAGVTLLEKTENIVKVDPSFFNTFKMQIPSDDVINDHDSYRDHDNLLNLAKWQHRA